MSTKHKKSKLPLKVDVVIPSIRIPIHKLEKVLNLRIPKQFWSKFKIIVSIDTRDADFRKIKDLKSNYAHLHIVTRDERVQLPSGASAARNAGAESSDADWIIFLDDDVVVEPGLLEAYANALLKYSNCNDNVFGFVGVTEFQIPEKLFGLAVKSQGMVSPFVVARQKRFPVWAPTSNLMLRRDCATKFDETLPKSGGSEDVELCARLYEGNNEKCGLISVPNAIVSHDLWRPSATLRRAFRWGSSSVDLQIRHRNYTHLGYPDTVETIVILVFVWTILSIVCYESIVMSWWWFTFAIALILIALHEMVIWVVRIMSNMRFNQYSLISNAEDGSVHIGSTGIKVEDLVRVSKSDGGFIFYICVWFV